MIIGGVVGDWIKGTLPGVLPEDIAMGVALHRAIDSFAESHSAFCLSRTRVSAVRRRYAGVLVDVFYDHLLASNWSKLDQTPLHEFCDNVYRLINDRMLDLPLSAHAALKLMAKEDWLNSYAKIEGIADVLARMSRRARQPNPLAKGELELLADIDGFTSDFHIWFNDAREFSQRWKSKMNNKMRTP